jgi:XRE family transcriptional regulator, regulator of sulfur utilization
MRLIGLVLAALFVGCAPAIGGAQSPPVPASPPLLETTWVTIELAGVPVPLTPTERQPSLRFAAGGRVSGSDGCNRISATYTLAGSRITFGPIAATRMACPGIESLAGKFEAALTGAVRWRLAGARLQLFGENDILLAAFEAGKGGATAGEEPPQAPSSVPPSAPPSGPPPGPPSGAANPPAGATTPLVSKVFDWGSLTAVPIPNGERRMVLDGPTGTVDLLHVHVTTLAPGRISGAPVRHLQEEVLIVKDGAVEVSLDGTTQTVGPGAILFFAAGAVTGLRNVGATPATYYVIYYKTPRTPKA